MNTKQLEYESDVDVFDVAVGDLELYPGVDVIPRMKPAELEAFKRDVDLRGITEPIHVIPKDEGGYWVLDGRHRIELAKERGWNTLKATVPDLRGLSPLDYAIRQATIRRHLNDDQVAIIVAWGYAMEVKAGKSGHSSEDTSNSIPNGRLRQRMAKESGIPERKLKRAITLVNYAPELADTVGVGSRRLLDACRELDIKKRRAVPISEGRLLLARKSENADLIDKIYIGDCLGLLRGMADGSVDGIVTSIPYENQKHYTDDPSDLGRYKGAEFVDVIRPVFQEMFRVLKVDGSAFINFRPQMIEGVLSSARYLMPAMFEGVGFKCPQDINWIKSSASLSGNPKIFDFATEHIHHLAKGLDYYANTDAVRRPDFWAVRDSPRKKTDLAERFDWLSLELDKFCDVRTLPPGQLYERFREIVLNPKLTMRDVLLMLLSPGGNAFPFAKETFGMHPAKMPEELARFFILYGSRPDDVILDPFMGIGTVACQAKALGRHYVGFEINPDDAAITEARLSKIQFGKDLLKDVK